MRGTGTLVLVVGMGCGPSDRSKSAEDGSLRWVAAGLGRCNALVATQRSTVIAACEQGAVEVGADAAVTTLHASMVDHVALDQNSLWVKLSDQLLRGPLPRPGQAFTAHKSLELGTIDDLLAVPGHPLVVATPGTLLKVSPEATASRWRKVPVPMRQLTLGPSSEIYAVSNEAIFAVELHQFRQVIGGLDAVAAATTSSDGTLLVASGQPARIGRLDAEGYAPTDLRIEGVTDLTVLTSAEGASLWFTTADGSIGYTAVP